MPGTDTLDRPVSSGTRRTAALSPAARRAAAGPAPDAGRPRGQARAVWFAVTAALNGGFVAWSVARGEVGSRAVEWSLAAFCIAVAARHDGIVRAAFVLGRLIRSYRLHQLTYHLGQLHRAMAIAGVAWLAVAAAVASSPPRLRAWRPSACLRSWSLWRALPGTGCVHPGTTASSQSTGSAAGRRWGSSRSLFPPGARSLPPGSGLAGLLRAPSVLLLAALVMLVAHPWLGVRRLRAEFLAVTAEVVVVALPGRRMLGEFVRVSREGREWHSFAVATTGGEGADRYCLVIRRAGDWTERLASDVEHGRAPARLWVRRMRGYGFMYHAQAYRRVLMVATGAGIGPVLPYLLGRSPVQLECLWIGRGHRAAMGPDLVDRVLAAGRLPSSIPPAGGRTWGRASPGSRTGSRPCSWSATTSCGTALPGRARRSACRGTARPSTHRPRVPASSPASPGRRRLARAPAEALSHRGSAREPPAL